MTRIKIISILILTLLALLALSSRVILKPIGKITVVEAPPPSSNTGVTGGTVTVTAIVTGWVEAPAFILMDQKDPRTPDNYREARWVPSVSYVVTHPSKGTVVFDFGVKSGDCAFGLRPIYWVPCKTAGSKSLSTYLMENPHIIDDITYLAPSHFHSDHVGGLSDVLRLTQAPLLITESTLAELKSPARVISGVPSDMLKADMNVVLMDKLFVQDPLLGRTFDVFGDGSLKVFETTGHSDGHISALANTEASLVLLSFDAAHISANLDLEIPSGAVTDKDKANESLMRLKNIGSSLKDVQIIYGHEPDQWQCSGNTVTLGTGEVHSC